MTRTQVREKLIKIVVEQLGLKPDNPPADDARFAEDLNADSLDSVEVVMKIEDEFGEFDLKIPEEEVAKLKTVGNTVDYVFNALAEKRG